MPVGIDLSSRTIHSWQVDRHNIGVPGDDVIVRFTPNGDAEQDRLVTYANETKKEWRVCSQSGILSYMYEGTVSKGDTVISGQENFTIEVERGMVFRLFEKSLVCSGCGTEVDMKVVRGWRPNERGLEVMGFCKSNEEGYMKGVNAGDPRLICTSIDMCKKHGVDAVLPETVVASGAGCIIGSSCGCFEKIMVPVTRSKKKRGAYCVMKKKASSLNVDMMRISFLDEFMKPDATDVQIKANPRIVRTKPPHPLSCPDGQGGWCMPPDAKYGGPLFAPSAIPRGGMPFKAISSSVRPDWWDRTSHGMRLHPGSQKSPEMKKKPAVQSKKRKLDDPELEVDTVMSVPLPERVYVINDIDWQALECLVRCWEKWDLLHRLQNARDQSLEVEISTTDIASDR